jgi:hypothetical protein
VQAGLSLGQIILHKLLGDIRIEQVGQVIFEGLIGGACLAESRPASCARLGRQRPLWSRRPSPTPSALRPLSDAEDEPAAGESKGAEAVPRSQTARIRFGEDGVYAIGKAAACSPARSRSHEPVAVRWRLTGGWSKANSPAEPGLNREEAEAAATALKALRPDLN